MSASRSSIRKNADALRKRLKGIQKEKERSVLEERLKNGDGFEDNLLLCTVSL